MPLWLGPWGGGSWAHCILPLVALQCSCSHSAVSPHRAHVARRTQEAQECSSSKPGLGHICGMKSMQAQPEVTLNGCVPLHSVASSWAASFTSLPNPRRVTEKFRPLCIGERDLAGHEHSCGSVRSPIASSTCSPVANRACCLHKSDYMLSYLTQFAHQYKEAREQLGVVDSKSRHLRCLTAYDLARAWMRCLAQ